MAALMAAAEIVRSGGLVAFPTETVYGLGANAFDPLAVRGIFDAKGRPAVNPLIVHVANEVMLRLVIDNWTEKAAALANRFWPGPLTFVLAKTSNVPSVVTGGGATVAVRMPQHPVALGLIRAAGVPLAAPSANRSSELSPTRAEHVLEGLSGRIDLILDGGPTLNGIESTVIDLTSALPVLLRPGPISVAAIEAVVGPILLGRGPIESGPLPSPGMLARHYSPRTPVELFADRRSLDAREAELGAKRQAVAGVVFEEPGVVMPRNPASYASRLYAVLHGLDRRGLARILIELPPDTPEWLAVRDRLTRGASE
jgi:L-threonylcarbamoyladenylate synthase